MSETPAPLKVAVYETYDLGGYTITWIVSSPQRQLAYGCLFPRRDDDKQAACARARALAEAAREEIERTGRYQAPPVSRPAYRHDPHI